MGEERKLNSRHFIYFISSDLHITCILQKTRAKGQKHYLTQGYSVASGRLGILNSSLCDVKDLAASVVSGTGASGCISRLKHYSKSRFALV